MKQKINAALYAYWNDVRDGRIAPRRFDIEPSRIGDLLPHTFMLERSGGQNFRFRLAGTSLCEQFHADFRGANFIEGWDGDDALTLARQFEVMTSQGGVVLLTLEARSEGALKIEFEVIVLPLVHTQESVDRYLGAMSAINPPANLGSEPLTRKRLVHHEVIWPDGRPHKIVDRVCRQVPFLPHVRHARIVRSDRRQFRVYEGGLAKPDGEKF